MSNSSGIVLDLDFAEKSGTVAGDSSRYGNDGAVNGGVVWTEQGMRFDGSTGYLNCGNDASLECDTITISAWAKVTSWIAFKYILSKRSGSGEGYSIQVGGADLEFRAYLIDANIVLVCTDSLPPVNEWFHIVGTYDKVKGNVYINGVQQVGCDFETSGIKNDNSVLCIASHGGAGLMEETIGDIRIYNHALNASEIKAYYDSTKHRYK